MRARRLGVAVLCLALVGCGQASGPEDPDAADGPTTPRASEGQSPSSPDTAEARDTFGVTEADWPDDLEGAKAMFERMPTTLVGADRSLPQFFRGAAGVTYGRGNDAPVAWVMEADKEMRDPTVALAVMFGMTMSCEKDSYRGTAPRSDHGSVPDADRSGQYDPDGGWWFACTIAGAEGAPKFTGQAVGWASGELGWLTTTPDRTTSRALLQAMRDASTS